MRGRGTRLLGAVAGLGLALGLAGCETPATTERVSLTNTERQATWAQVGCCPHMSGVDVSGDGRFVVFQASGTSFTGDERTGVILRDRHEGRTWVLGLGLAPSVSDDGTKVAFIRDTRVLVWNRETGTTTRVDKSTGGVLANSGSYPAVISGDGRFVAFSSWASNLVAGDTNRIADVFVRNLSSNVTTRVSLSSTGQQGTYSFCPLAAPGCNNGSQQVTDISDDGRFVVFTSVADDLSPSDGNGLPDTYVRDRTARTTTFVSVDGSRSSVSGAVSAAGRYVTFWQGGNGEAFRFDRTTGGSERVDVPAEGQPPHINGGSNGAPVMSDDGRYVAFASGLWTLVDGDTNGNQDVFVRDMLARKTERVSLTASGAEAGGLSFGPSVNSDGSLVGFASDAANLVSGDTNAMPDVFVRYDLR